MFKGPIALGTLRTSFVLGLRLVVQTGTLLLVSYILEPAAFGLFAGAASVSVLLGTLSTFGINFLLLSELSRDSANRNKVLSYAIPTTLVFGCLVFFVYQGFVFFLLNDEKTVLFLFFAIGMTEIFIQPLFSLMATEQHGIGRIARSQLVGVLPLVLRFLSVSLVLISKVQDPLYWYACGYFFASVISLVIGRWTLTQSWPALKDWRLARVSELKQAAGFAVINFSNIGSLELDKALALNYLPLASAGIYAVSVRVISSVTLPVTALVLAALPRLFREGAQASRPSGRLFVWLFSATLFYSVALATIVYFFSPFLKLIFEFGYFEIVDVVQALCWVIPGIALRLVSGSIIISLGLPWTRAVYEICGIVVLAVLTVFLAPVLGVDGMVLALIVAEWSMAISGFLLCFRYSRQLKR